MDRGTEPTIRQLRYAVAVADNGNISRAAVACQISQPTLSAQLRELESHLGMVLFERGRHGATITPEGEPLVARARRVLLAVDELTEAAHHTGADLFGRLAIGVIPTMAPYLLPTVVAEIRRRHPRAQVVLREEKTADLVPMIEGGALDIGLLAEPVPSVTLDVAHLAHDAFLLAVAESSGFVESGPLPMAALAEWPMLLLEEGHCLRDQAIDVCAAAGVTARDELPATSLATLSQMVAGGAGATLLPASAVAVEARPGSGIAVRPLHSPVPSRSVVMAWRPTSPRKPIYRRLASALIGPVGDTCSTG